MNAANCLRVAATAVLGLSLAACAKRDSSPALATGAVPITVDAATLWDPNAAQDPVVVYRLRLDTEPGNPALHNNLGNLYALRNWMDEAVAEYKKAIDLDPASATAWNNLGTAYHKMGKRSSALSAFRHATGISPRYALAWYNIGTVLDENGDYDGAVDMYVKAASFQPGILDPTINPQVITNRKLLSVRLRRYLEQGGGLAVPLESMPE